MLDGDEDTTTERVGPTKLPPDLQAWVEARQRFHLSHAHVQNGAGDRAESEELGKIANHKQEPWKAPLPQFIEDIYEKRFHRERPEVVRPIEELQRWRDAKRAQKKAFTQERRSRDPGRTGPESQPARSTAESAEE